MWCENQTFKEVFPDLFNIAFIKDASMVDHLSFLMILIRAAHD
jgi:hypothetical protein